MHVRRPARLPQLLVGRAPGHPARQGDRPVLRTSRGHGRPVPVPARALPVRRRGRRGPDRLPGPVAARPWVVHPLGLWTDSADDDRAIRWARDLRADVKPWSTGAVYSNFIGQEGQERVVASYGLDNYRRLARIKATYDPDNTFHLNCNIRPER
ncbi:BBE domain-containing protein [Catellatospora coxensis]